PGAQPVRAGDRGDRVGEERPHGQRDDPLAHHREPITRAGTPAAIAPAGTSRVTTAPAPTCAPRPTVTPGRIVAPTPTSQPSSRTIGAKWSGPSMIGAARSGGSSCAEVSRRAAGPMPPPPASGKPPPERRQ